MNSTCRWVVVFALAWLPAMVALPAAEPPRPNVLFILADDLGIDGVSCYGADKRKTPNIDMSDAPFVEKPVAASADTDASKAARARLTTALAELNPAGGKTDGARAGAKAAKKKKKAQQ